MRPLYAMVEGNKPADVESCSRKAFSKSKMSLEARCEALCELRGVGVATASAVLSAWDEDYAFMSDEAMEVVLDAPAHGKKYDLDSYASLISQLRDKAAHIRKAEGPHGDGISTKDVELSIYATRHWWTLFRQHNMNTGFIDSFSCCVTNNPTSIDKKGKTSKQVRAEAKRGAFAGEGAVEEESGQKRKRQ